MIILLGTSHIAPESIRRIKNVIENENPDCVAVELDPVRYYTLKSKNFSRPPGIFLRFLAWLQRELGKMTGVFPGEEMLKAIEISNENRIPTFLIDQDFSITARDIKKVSFSEKFKLVVFTLFAGLHGEKIDLKKVPPKRVVAKAIKLLRKKFPYIYKVLVVKRNRHMANVIKNLSKDYKKILVVVGAGHVSGLKNLLKGEKVKIL
ncbi:MAG: TraB/GumN family protein [Candidatus Aenigmarchaeota archaeon]|nr:TraB/GumN family protein [Candidatus Aenigmarchaeota archaeon]